MENHHRGEVAAAQRVTEMFGVECTRRYIKSETENGNLPVVLFANTRWYSDEDLRSWFASKRKVSTSGGAA